MALRHKNTDTDLINIVKGGGESLEKCKLLLPTYPPSKKEKKIRDHCLVSIKEIQLHWDGREVRKQKEDYECLYRMLLTLT